MIGDFDVLSEKHGTCVYRVVQEALTNCARHAQAQNIKIDLLMRDGELQLVMTDDGVGLDPARHRSGLGLRGIDERVRELAGTMSIARGSVRGTVLVARLPLPAVRPEARHASIAG
jgi:signal transduction histidine kinase